MKVVNGVEWFAVFQANPDKLKLFLQIFRIVQEENMKYNGL